MNKVKRFDKQHLDTTLEVTRNILVISLEKFGAVLKKVLDLKLKNFHLWKHVITVEKHFTLRKASKNYLFRIQKKNHSSNFFDNEVFFGFFHQRTFEY